MKKLLSLVCALFLFSFSGCGSPTLVPPPVSAVSSEQSASQLEFDRDAFEKYLRQFALWYHSPITSSEELQRDSGFSEFLMWQAMTRKGLQGEEYPMNADGTAWLIQTSDFKALAEMLYGIPDLDIGSITG